MPPPACRRRDPSTLLPTLADCFTIDIRAWKREGKHATGHCFRLNWGSHRTPSAMLGVNAGEDRVVLMFQRLTQGYHHLQIAEESVAFLHTPNAVSGALTWFLCPGCGEKRYKLYALKDVKFRCRECVGLRHDRLSNRDRRALRLAKINRKLGVPHWLPSAEVRKPHCMHRKTFEKLRAEKAALEGSGIREIRVL